MNLNQDAAEACQNINFAFVREKTMDANENNERISKPSLCLQKKKKILIERIDSEKIIIHY